MTDHTPSDYVCCASRMKRRLEEEMKRLKKEKEMEQPAIVESLEQRANRMELDGMLAEQLAANSGNIWDDYKVSRPRTGIWARKQCNVDPSAATGSHQ